MNRPAEGFDAAQTEQKHDDLDRWRFAADLADVIASTPADWSARVGIFGKWGEGKSTVLRFAERLLEQQGNIVMWFSPWAAGSWDDLWDEFGDQFLEALSHADIPFDDTWKKKLRDSGRWLESKGAGQAIELAGGVFGKEKIATAGFRLVGRWLSYDGAQIKSIRQKLGQKRIVVLVDDLDRCFPDLLPRLLMSLREILDLPGFTFLLAFDDEIVARAISDANPAWEGGSNFLDKILDFQFHLPAVTAKQKEQFVCTAIEKYCPFIPLESIGQVLDLLPDNPRRLKSLIRSLASLQPQIKRHDADELNWVDMWLAQMLRQESYNFFEVLLVGDSLERVAGSLYSISRRFADKDEAKNPDAKLGMLLKEARIEDEELRARLTKLIEACRSRSSDQFRYMSELANRPPALTWKEFRSLYEHWEVDPQPEVLKRLVLEHSESRAVTTDDTETELFQALLVQHSQLLSKAAESKLTEEHDSYAVKAKMMLNLIGQFLSDPSRFNVERFRKLYGQLTYWIGFTKNSTDAALRGEEQRLLLNLLAGVSGELSADLLETFLPAFEVNLGDGTYELKESLRQKCMAIVAPRAAEEAVSFLTREGGIRSLTEPDRFRSIRFCLFSSESPVWTTDLRVRLVALIRQGRENSSIYSNADELFEILIRSLGGGSAISLSDARFVLGQQDFAEALWATVTSKPIQYRMQLSYLNARKFLLENGTLESAIPLTEALQLRAEEEARKTKSEAEEQGTEERGG